MALFTPASPPTAAPADRTYLLERVGEAAVVQVYADAFRDLPLREKTLIWHLAQAAIAGRDIFYDQRYAHNLEMRDVLEAIVTHAGKVRQVGPVGQVRQVEHVGRADQVGEVGQIGLSGARDGGDAADALEQTLRAIEEYTKLFWINTGPYNNLTARKFILECSPAVIH